MTNIHFPNGFQDWAETHHEIVELTANALRSSNDAPINKRYQENGRGWWYEWCIELATEFEELNKGREWDGDFFDEIERFVLNKIKSL